MNLRWIRCGLLLLLLPLLWVALIHAARYDNRPINDLQFSPDGRKLFIIRQDHDYIQFDKWRDAPCEIQVWDVASHQLESSRIVGNGVAAVTIDGTHFVNVTTDGRVFLLDAVSLETQKQWQLPNHDGPPSRVIATDKLLLIEESVKGNRRLNCFSLRDRQPSLLWSRDRATALISPNGRRLFVSQATGPTSNPVWTCDVFDLNNELSFELPQTTLPGLALLVSPDGEAAFVFSGSPAATVVVNLKTAKTFTLQRNRSSRSCSFTPDGKFIDAIDYQGVLETYDIETGDPVASQELEGNSINVEFTTSSFQHLVVTDPNYYQVRIWDRQTGTLQARLPDPRFIRYFLAAAFLIWCAAWIPTGLRVQQPRPWLDVLLINALPLSVFVLHSSTRPLTSIHPTAIGIGVGLLVAVMGLFVTWWILSQIRWSLRFAGLVAGVGLVAAALTTSGNTDTYGREGAWNILLGSVSYILVLALLLRTMRWFRFQLRKNPATGDEFPQPAKTAWQVPLRDLLLVTAALALLLTVMRFANPGFRGTLLVLYVSLHGLLLAGAVFLCCLAAFLKKHFLLHALPAFAGSLLLGAVPAIALAQWGADPLWWIETLYATAAAATLVSLSVFRLHGYRLGIQKVPLRSG